MSSESCIFCRIVQGEIPAHKVYEDEYVLAFLDLHPIRTGHLLVIPKFHEPDFYKLSENLYTQVMAVVQKLAYKVNDLFLPKKVGLIVSGFDVAHTHVHLVPMVDSHDITSKQLLEGVRTNPSMEELATVAKRFG
ncbi:HIT domain-containing protein [Candidatus Gracilibacteria bacterium]|nr:HIT domain-containing protein [Candidatus Gracilibacteria bacterium]